MNKFELEWKKYCASKGDGAVTMNVKEVACYFYEQGIKDMQESFKKLQLSTECAIDAVTALKSLLDNPDIREKLGKSKPIPKKPIKTNPFFGGEKK